MFFLGEGPLHIFSPHLYCRPAGILGVHGYDFSAVEIFSSANEKATRRVARVEENKYKSLISHKKHSLTVCTKQSE